MVLLLLLLLLPLIVLLLWRVVFCCRCLQPTARLVLVRLWLLSRCRCLFGPPARCPRSSVRTRRFLAAFLPQPFPLSTPWSRCHTSIFDVPSSLPSPPKPTATKTSST
ncbi:unnamed protein product [Ectocarpus sp. 4 AP-2014]